FAARYLVAAKMNQRLIVSLEAAVAQRLPQILLHAQAGLRAGAHRALEEAVRPPSTGLCRIHRKIGVLDQLIVIGAVLRRHGDAERGVGRELVTEALMGLPDRYMNPPDQVGGLVGGINPGLHHGELVTAEPG